MQIFLIVVGAVVVYVLYTYKKHNDRLRDFPGLSTLDFFKDYRNIAGQTARWTKEKFAKVDTPAFTLILATHPDSAKVNNFTSCIPHNLLYK